MSCHHKYWNEKKEYKLTKQVAKTFISSIICFFLAYQCSSRGGEVKLEIRDDGRVDIIGQALIILQGTLKI